MRLSKNNFLFFVLSLSCLVSCGPQHEKFGKSSDPPPIKEGEPITFEDIQMFVFVPANCAKCHSGVKPEAELDITDQMSVLERVVGGNPLKSLLYQKTNPVLFLQTKPGGDLMPPLAENLSTEQLEMIRQWISDLQIK